ncbi:EAL domain-containing protein [Aestuariirhabdus litorea]|uniref:EAL domain-containing protein n=2 Tax=Aestuariirhabdus litorea TaxID=2528527 RepID=A0A3P3VSJ1_9GAMM|nr:EAL domain-containing protein [Aestuariirhabdus litorea]
MLLTHDTQSALRVLLLGVLITCFPLTLTLLRELELLHLFASEDSHPRLLVNREGALLEHNQAATGFPLYSDTPPHSSFERLFEPKERPQFKPLLGEARRLGSAHHLVSLHLNGSLHHFSLICTPTNAGHRDGDWLLSFYDITELQMLGHALEQTGQHYQQVVDLTAEGLLLLDGRRITFANQSAARLLGMEHQDALLHRDIRDFFSKPQWKKASGPLKPLFKKQRFELEPVELELTTEKRFPIVVEATAKPFLFQESQSTLLSLRDIGHQKAEQQQLERAAHYDEVTNLPNRHYFLEQLSRVISRSHRSPTEHAVLFIDLDNFKEINDSLGHQTGDLVLQEVARRLNNHSRRENTLARLGGDEFSLLLENISSPYEASSVAGNIVELLGAPIRLQGHTRWVTPSIGIALYPQNGTTTKELLKNADTAMYHAKRAGKNAYRFFSADMNRILNRRLQMEQELDEVLAQRKLQVYFQPRVRPHDRKVVGLEALARWKNNQGELVTPGEHLHVAQQSQLVFRFEQEIMTQLNEQLKRWRLLGVNFGTLSLNLSTALLEDSDQLLERLAQLKPDKTTQNQLEVELDASVLLDANPRVSTLLERISRMGFKLAIDHFGSNPASFTLLGSLPIHSLKIDQALIKEIDHSPEAQRILKTIALVAHSLDIKVSTTGVETGPQAQWLQQLGCDLMQGFLFYPPQDAKTTTHLLLSSDSAHHSSCKEP